MWWFVALAGVGVGVVVLAGAWARRHVPSGSVEQRAKVSDALSKGLALLTAVLAIVASRDGGVGRLVANGTPYVWVALVLVIGSVLLAFASWLVVAQLSDATGGRAWAVLGVASVVAFALACAAVGAADAEARQRLERPVLSVKQTEAGVEVTASIELLAADDFMTIEIAGYPDVDDRTRRDLLYHSLTGPDAKGRAAVTSAVRTDLTGYEVVIVYAYRGAGPPRCDLGRSEEAGDERDPVVLGPPTERDAETAGPEREPVTASVVPDGDAPAGCAALFVTPYEQRAG